MIVQVADNPSVGNPFIAELPWKGDRSTWIVEKAVKMDEGTLRDMIHTMVAAPESASWTRLPGRLFRARHWFYMILPTDTLNSLYGQSTVAVVVVLAARLDSLDDFDV
jgi:hypothetical protein